MIFNGYRVSVMLKFVIYINGQYAYFKGGKNFYLLKSGLFINRGFASR